VAQPSGADRRPIHVRGLTREAPDDPPTWNGITSMLEFAESVHALPSADAEYRFGQPKTYLSPHELARLMLLRCKLGETQVERAAERRSLAGRRTSTGPTEMRSRRPAQAG
jgi:hypothetical protein